MAIKNRLVYWEIYHIYNFHINLNAYWCIYFYNKYKIQYNIRIIFLERCIYLAYINTLCSTCIISVCIMCIMCTTRFTQRQVKRVFSNLWSVLCIVTRGLVQNSCIFNSVIINYCYYYKSISLSHFSSFHILTIEKYINHVFVFIALIYFSCSFPY